MQTIKASAVYVPVAIEIGDRTVEGRIDLSPDNLLTVGEVCGKAADEAKHWQRQLDQAVAGHDTAAFSKLNARISKVVGAAVKAVYGEECYEEVLEALGGGRRVPPKAATRVLCQMLMAANEYISEAMAETSQVTAAHYLAEVARGADEPGAAQDAD